MFRGDWQEEGPPLIGSAIELAGVQKEMRGEVEDEDEDEDEEEEEEEEENDHGRISEGSIRELAAVCRLAIRRDGPELDVKRGRSHRSGDVKRSQSRPIQCSPNDEYPSSSAPPRSIPSTPKNVSAVLPSRPTSLVLCIGFSLSTLEF